MCNCKVTSESVTPNRAIETIIEDVKVYCPSRSQELEDAIFKGGSKGELTDGDADNNGNNESAGPAAAGSGKRKSSSSSSSNVAASEKKSKPDHCTWIGKLADTRKHLKECPYAGAVSRCDCQSFQKEIQLLRQDIQTLRQDNQTLRNDNQTLREKVDEQAQLLSRQPQEIVFTVNIADLLRPYEVHMNSDSKRVGAYNAVLRLESGNAVLNGHHCGMHLYIDDGPFPCHVMYYLEVVHWNGIDLSARKVEFTQTYKFATAYGLNKMVILCPWGPYMNEGRITFIAKFQILPLM